MMTSSSGWFSSVPWPLALMLGSISAPPSRLLTSRLFLRNNGCSPPNHINYYNQKRTEDMYISMQFSKSSKYLGIAFMHSTVVKRRVNQRTQSPLLHLPRLTQLCFTGFTTMQIWSTDGELFYDLKLLLTVGFTT